MATSWNPQWKQAISNACVAVGEFWLHPKFMQSDLYVSLISLAVAQTLCGTFASILSMWIPVFAGAVVMKIIYWYLGGVLLSLILLRIGSVSGCMIISYLNASIVVAAGSLLLCPDNSMWVYFIPNAISSMFFVKTTPRIRVMTVTCVLLSILFYIVAVWMQLFEPDILPGYERLISRFGIINKAFGFTLVLWFISYFHRKTTEYQLSIEAGAQALAGHLQMTTVCI
jgi:hypothetical protein